MWHRIGTIVLVPAGRAYDAYYWHGLSPPYDSGETPKRLTEVRETIADSGVSALDREYRLVPAGRPGPTEFT